jgi:hypothetical protein
MDVQSPEDASMVHVCMRPPPCVRAPEWQRFGRREHARDSSKIEGGEKDEVSRTPSIIMDVQIVI